MKTYQEGRHRAMEVLGLRPKAKDNELVAGFVEALGEDSGKKPKSGDDTGRLNRQSWGRKLDFATSDQIVSGGGTRL